MTRKKNKKNVNDTTDTLKRFYKKFRSLFLQLAKKPAFLSAQSTGALLNLRRCCLLSFSSCISSCTHEMPVLLCLPTVYGHPWYNSINTRRWAFVSYIASLAKEASSSGVTWFGPHPPLDVPVHEFLLPKNLRHGPHVSNTAGAQTHLRSFAHFFPPSNL